MIRVLYPDGRLRFPAPSDLTPGTIVTRPDGSLAYFDGLENAAAGDEISPEPLHPTPIVAVPKSAAADAFAAGDDVSIGGDGKKAVTGAGRKIGVAALAAAAGSTEVLVRYT